jgi:hypothetical protein
MKTKLISTGYCDFLVMRLVESTVEEPCDRIHKIFIIFSD